MTRLGPLTANVTSVTLISAGSACASSTAASELSPWQTAHDSRGFSMPATGPVGPVGPVAPAGPVGPAGPVAPGAPGAPAAPSLPSSPSQPARPIVAASANIAINGTRDRVMPRAPANFMVDSLENSRIRATNVRHLTDAADSGAIVGGWESSQYLG